MTLEERIKAGARIAFELGRDYKLAPNEEPPEWAITGARDLLAAAFPELFSVPPTGWIAPVEIDGPMIAAMQAVRSEGNGDDAWEWSCAREFWLERHPMKPTEAKE